jgi:hypothetical protein
MATQGIKITDLPDKSTINVTEPNNYIILTTDDGTLKLPLDTLFYSISSAISKSFKIQNFLINDCIKKEHIKDGEVTTNELETSINTKLNNISIPIGCVMAFANTSAPAGWLACNGDIIGTSGTVQGINVSSLQTIRSYLGTNFGVTGQLPDLRGYFVRGFGTNLDNTISNSFGVKTKDTIGPFSISIDSKLEKFTSQEKNKQGIFKDVIHNGGGSGLLGSVDRSKQTITSDTINGGSTETQPKNISLLYCIKY